MSYRLAQHVPPTIPNPYDAVRDVQDGADATRTGKYDLLATIAQGGMADVFLAVSRGPLAFQKLVVIKAIRQELADDPDFLAMFLDEARLAARLNHTNVVQTYEVGTEGGRHVLVMEHLEGVPYVRLARLKDRIAVPLAIHLRILSSTLAGLHYAHELQDFDGTPLSVVHRDVSPQNVLVTFDGGVKVLDFGVAKMAMRAERRSEDLKGKLAYMAPEHVAGGPVDRRADVFCVGVMLWEAIARRRLWAKGSDNRPQVRFDDIPDLRAVRSDVPVRLAEICARALALNPDDRFATAAEMQQELEDYLEDSGPQVNARSLGRFVSEKFAEERKILRATIDDQLRRLEELAPDRGTSLQTLPFGPDRERPSIPPNLRASGVRVRAPEWPAPAVPEAMGAKAGVGRAVLLVSALLFTLSLAAMIGAWQLRKPPAVVEARTPRIAVSSPTPSTAPMLLRADPSPSPAPSLPARESSPAMRPGRGSPPRATAVTRPGATIDFGY